MADADGRRAALQRLRERDLARHGRGEGRPHPVHQLREEQAGGREARRQQRSGEFPDARWNGARLLERLGREPSETDRRRDPQPPEESGPKVVIDASAVIAAIRDEVGAEIVEAILPVAVVPATNLVESVVVLAGHHPDRVRETLHDLEALGLVVEPVLPADVERAAALVVESRTLSDIEPGHSTLSLGDATCMAVAERLRLPVTGGDELWADLRLRVDYLPFR